MDLGVAALPEHILNAAGEALNSLIPEKSKSRYEKAYNAFKQLQGGNHIEVINENVLLAYFQQLSKKHSLSSLWVYYSMLRSTIDINENINIKAFQKLYAFVKRQNVGNEVKKAKVLSDCQFKKFLIEARDEEYLLPKVVAIFGLFGACRCDEIYNLAINDIKEEGSVLIVTVNKTKNYKPRFFTVVSEGAINSVQIVKKYMSLRPKHTTHEHVFVFYNRGKCSVQRSPPLSVFPKILFLFNKISSVPKMIATFLGLPNTDQYTGHCLRRTSATILANTGGNVTDLKRLGGWKSSSRAEGYVEESVDNKVKIAKRMFGSGESSASSSTVRGEIINNKNTTEVTQNASSHVETSEISFPGITFSNLKDCNNSIYYGKQEQ